MKRNTDGFTLIELLVVMVLVTVLAGFTSIGFDFVRRERVAATARELVADLQHARLNAMTGSGKGTGIRLVSGGKSYVIFKFEDCNDDYTYDKDACDGKREEKVLSEKKMPDSLVLTKTNPFTNVNDDVRIFDRFGSPRWPTWGAGGITIVISSVPDAGLTKCIAISQNRIREGVWKNSDCL